ncbi:TVP38/TMEM64 family protein [Modestobacter roseus]|uniref:TVP38/TMEM64 family membrane protein n=1 Tax=Modestobacter roseus TaxID=1181884 RepID=A0A562IW81_9ACTN|nr:VTT domain-containing protein [Modestobacter roseus]MQA35708.1 TVP38/TMEM64 family protein [Modestobacter roseus]TWH74875.1 putative membrane protein YdjX (TVP38/TMEM64 family) [Modestobacter roseus]
MTTQERHHRLPAPTAGRAALLLVLLLCGAALALVVDVPGVGEVRRWLDDAGPAGWAGLLAGLALATLAPVPRTALSVLAGVLAGFWGGLALALPSGVLGALAGFTLARLLGREAVTRLAGPRLLRADALLTDRGVLAVLIARLTPVLPFTLISYAGGLSGMRLRDHLLGSAVGLTPGTVLHVAVGASVGAAGLGDGRTLLLTLVPLTLALLALAGARWWRRRAAPAGRAAEETALPSSTAL